MVTADPAPLTAHGEIRATLLTIRVSCARRSNRRLRNSVFDRGRRRGLSRASGSRLQVPGQTRAQRDRVTGQKPAQFAMTPLSETHGEDKTSIGVISDTHGLMRPEAIEVLQGVDLILHAGDIGTPQVLQKLKTIAPVIAVTGNSDMGEWMNDLPQRAVVQVGAVYILMLHDRQEIDLNPAAAGFRVVVSGHSHRPSVEERNGIVYVNPGGAGPRRFKLPISVVRLTIEGAAVSGRIIELSVQRGGLTSG